MGSKLFVDYNAEFELKDETKRDIPMRIIMREIKIKLTPTQIFIPAEIILMVVGNENDMKVSVKTFGMRKLRM
jgi:hypothetical protein